MHTTCSIASLQQCHLVAGKKNNLKTLLNALDFDAVRRIAVIFSLDITDTDS